LKYRIFSPKARNRAGIFLLVCLDVLTLLGLFYLAGFVRGNIVQIVFHKLPGFSLNIKTYYWIFPVWFFFLIQGGGYSRRFTFWDEVKFLSRATFFSSVTIFTILFIGKMGAAFSRMFILTMSLLALAVFPVVRTQLKRLLYSLGLLKRKIIILGAGEAGRLALCAIRNEPNLGYEIAGFIDDRPSTREIDGIRVHGFAERVDRYIRRCGIHDIVIAKPEYGRDKLAGIINTIQHKVDNTLYLPDLTGVAVLGTELKHFFSEQVMVIEIKNNLARPFNYAGKRAFDYVVGGILFIFLLAPIFIISIAIRLTSRGPAIFRQERIGKNGRPFMCYKFRTMHLDAEERLRHILDTDPEARAEWEKYWKLRNDPRVTKIGRFLRRTSLDELPQIINVVRGEMSLVGPRPVTRREIVEYYKDAAQLCFSVPPGITGLWQVSGRNNTTYKQRVSLDSWYVRNWNLWLDIVILFKTVRVVFRSEGAC